MIRSLFVLALSATLLISTQVHAANKPGDCEYFAQFLMKLRAFRDDGKSKQETTDFARAKAKQDHLDGPTRDLFVGEAIGLYYEKPRYVGTQSQVHDIAYKACITNDLP